MMYLVIEEASEAVCCITDNFDEAKQEAKSRQGKYIVIDEDDVILFDSNPEISYKI